MEFSKCICLCHCLVLVRSCLLITLIKCLKGHKSLRSLCCSKIKSGSVSQSVSESVSQWQGHLLSCQTVVWTAKKGPNQPGRGRPPHPLNGRCPFKNVFFVWTPSLISTIFDEKYLPRIILFGRQSNLKMRFLIFSFSLPAQPPMSA